VRQYLMSIVIAAAGSGCAGSLAHLRTENHRLAGDNATLRSELRSERRKSKDLATQVLVLHDHVGPDTTALALPIAGPQLPIEVLSPDNVTDNGSLVGTSDDGSEIVYIGDAVAPAIELYPDDIDQGARAPRSIARPMRDLPTSTELREPGRSSPVAASPGQSEAAMALYRQGQAALKDGDHAGAVTAFRALIVGYPTHDYADNAQYWIGETFYDQKDFGRAISEFRATVSGYPQGNKVPDALLKIGLAYAALGESAKSKAALEQVIRQFPKTAPATLAAARLEHP
jgi:tol-pal system protein YbgF